jgi:hypothetical protein
MKDRPPRWFALDPPSDERSGTSAARLASSPGRRRNRAAPTPNVRLGCGPKTPAVLATRCGPRPGLTRSPQWVSLPQHRIVATPDPVDEDRRSSHAMGKRSLRPVIAYASALRIHRGSCRGGHARSHCGPLVLQPLTSAPPTPTGSVVTGACGWGQAGRGVEQRRVCPWRSEGWRWA